MYVKDPKDKASEIIGDYIALQPMFLSEFGMSLNQQYEFARLQANYCAIIAKYSHSEKSKEYVYWANVQQEIKNLNHG